MARRIREAGARRVIIMQVLYREGRACLPWWERRRNRSVIHHAEGLFNDMVRRYNRRMVYLCKYGLDSMPGPDHTIVPRRQKGLLRRYSSRLGRDGCHLTPYGLRVYYRNIRRILIAEGMKARDN